MKLCRFLLLSFSLLLSSVSVLAQDSLRVWRGERMGFQFDLVFDETVEEPMRLSVRHGNSVTSVEAGPLRNVITDDFRSCGKHPDGLPAWEVLDVIDAGGEFVATKGTPLPLWLSAEINPSSRSGRKRLRVDAVGVRSGRVYAQRDIYYYVVPRTLPSPHDYLFHLNFWQQPYSVSRYYGVKRWSDQHLNLLRPYMQRLARAGQKVVSAILFYEPWGDQSHDKFSPMVETTLCADGTWQYDYTIFDRWVRFMASCGIDKQIDCYSMIPWDMSFRYWDERSQDYKYLSTTTSSEEYRQLWISFLRSFAEHLRSEGWLAKTCIAMDERGINDMLRAYAIAQEAVPGIRFSLAGNHHAELVPLLQDYSIAFGQNFTAEEIKARRERGQTSTLYTCCTEAHPNLLTNCHPLEATYLPLHCVARGVDGYLHWSWINWNSNPLRDSRYRLFSPGDTYCVYPGNRSSVRWERFVQGVQMTEKIHQIRLSSDSLLVKKMETELCSFEDGQADDPLRVHNLIVKLQNLLNL